MKTMTLEEFRAALKAQGVVLDAWTKLHADMANQKPAKEGA